MQTPGAFLHQRTQTQQPSATLANAPIRLNPSTSKASTIPFGLTKSRAIIPLA